jgi:hypothetical protein
MSQSERIETNEVSNAAKPPIDQPHGLIAAAAITEKPLQLG